jgi:hypothetical protein
VNKRTIFIGDIQGCYEEFMTLLEKLEYDTNKDQLYLVGDTINRGPGSDLVLDFLIANPQIKSVLGNHEYHFLEFAKSDNQSVTKHFSKLLPLLKGKLKQYIEFMDSWPPFIENEKWFVVHAGLLPNEHPKDSDPEKLCHIRDITYEGKTAPWFEFYNGDKLIIYGHWAKMGLVDLPKVKGLDSGCVYGRTLTAYIFEENRFISTPAQKVWYDPHKKLENW